MKLPLEVRIKQHKHREQHFRWVYPQPWFWFINLFRKDKIHTEYYQYIKNLRSNNCHSYLKTRNGHVEESASKGFIRIHISKEFYEEEYQMYCKPFNQMEEFSGLFNQWLEDKTPGSYYYFHKETKKMQSRHPGGGMCWCALMGDFLLEMNYYSHHELQDGGSVTEVWKIDPKLKNVSIK